MVSIINLYELSEKEWLDYFILLKACEKEVFHKSFVKDSWAIEKIMRHLLDSLIQMNNNALKTEKLQSNLVFPYNENPKDRVPLEAIEKEYHRLNKVVHKGMEAIDGKSELEDIQLGNKKFPRGRYLIYLLAHDHSHFGQIIWILKRLTKWTMEDISKILAKKSEQ